LIDQRLRDMAEGVTEAIDQEVELLRRERLPIYVSDNGKVVDLQQVESNSSPPPQRRRADQPVCS
jgi:hypothetical protein